MISEIFNTRNYLQPPTSAATPKFKEDDSYIVKDINFGIICAADFNNAIRFYVRRPARRLRVTCRHTNS